MGEKERDVKLTKTENAILDVMVKDRMIPHREEAHANLIGLGLAKLAEHPEIPGYRTTEITDRGRSYANGENVLSERREKIMEQALAALRMVLSLHALTDACEAVPRDGEGAYLVELPPEALEVTKKAAESMEKELELIF